jgi:hypothetical protein
MWVGVVFLGVVMAAATLLTIDLYLLGGLIVGTHDLANHWLWSHPRARCCCRSASSISASSAQPSARPR